MYLVTNVTTDAAASPELSLVSAMLQQALKDARAGRGNVRQEARDFLAGGGAHLQFWESLLGLPDGALARLTRHVLDA